MIAFRGSVLFGTNDWFHNFRAFSTETETPSIIEEEYSKRYKGYISVHEGSYSEYIFLSIICDYLKSQIVQFLQSIYSVIQIVAENVVVVLCMILF